MVSPLTNHDFETGSLSGWTTSGTVSAVSRTGDEGSYCAKLEVLSGSGESNISQTIDLTGIDWLTFWYDLPYPTGNAEFRVKVGGTTVFSELAWTNNWIWQSIDVSSYSGSQTIEFELLNTYTYGDVAVYIDDIERGYFFDNSNFEHGDLTHWTVSETGDYAECEAMYAQWYNSPPYSYAADINAMDTSGASEAYIEQSIDFTGVATLKFMRMVRQLYGSGTKTFYVKIDGTTVHSATALDNGGDDSGVWTDVSVDVSAYSGTKTLRFGCSTTAGMSYITTSIDEIQLILTEEISSTVSATSSTLATLRGPSTCISTTSSSSSTSGSVSVDIKLAASSTMGQSVSGALMSFYQYTPVTFTTRYNINHGAASKFVVRVNPDLEAGTITDIKVKRRLNQIDSCSFRLIKPTETELAFFEVGDAVSIVINDFRRFNGIVTRREREDKVNVWNIFCEGAAAILRDEVVTESTVYLNETVDSIIVDLLPSSGWIHSTTDTSTNRVNFRVTQSSSLLTSLDSLCKLAGRDWHVEKNDSGYYVFSTVPRRRTTTPTRDYTLYDNCAYLVRKKVADATVTSVVCVGIQPEVARLSSTFDMVVPDSKLGEFYTHETFVTYPVAADDTTIYAEDTTDYFSSNGTIQIGDEQIEYTGKTATTFTNCTRGANSTTAASHAYGADVLNLDYFFIKEPVLGDMPAFGTVKVGEESIYYTSRTAGAFQGLTRGMFSTPKYSHSYGAPVYDSTYNTTTPHGESPVALFGLRRVTIENLGAIDRNGLDVVANRCAYALCNAEEYGDFMALHTDFWTHVNLGDYITITDDDETMTVVLVGVDYDQFKPMHIYFGVPEEYIFDNISKIERATSIAREKDEQEQKATVVSLSSDGKSAYVTLPDGTQKWVEIV